MNRQTLSSSFVSKKNGHTKDKKANHSTYINPPHSHPPAAEAKCENIFMYCTTLPAAEIRVFVVITFINYLFTFLTLPDAGIFLVVFLRICKACKYSKLAHVIVLQWQFFPVQKSLQNTFPCLKNVPVVARTGFVDMTLLHCCEARVKTVFCLTF